MKKILIVCCLITLLSCQTCPQDLCKSQQYVLTGCRVPVPSANQNNLQACLSGFTCNAETNYCQLIDPLRLQRPGENCYRDSDCVTNFCVLGCPTGKDCQKNNTCQTQLTGQNCTQDVQCPANHRCLLPKGSTTNKQCLPLSSAGTNCNDPQNSTWCTWGTLCAKVDGQSNYYCTQAFSVAARYNFEVYQGAIKMGTIDSTAYLCTTGYYNSTNKTCALSAPYLQTYPKQCQTSNDCPLAEVYEYKGDQACSCSVINQNGTGFCTPTLQDSGYLDRLRSAYSSSYSDCPYWKMLYREAGCFRDLDSMNIDISTGNVVKDYNCYVKAGFWPYSSFDGLLASSGADKAVCPKYTCYDYNTYYNLENGACVVYKQGSLPHTYDIYNCPNGYYCQNIVGTPSETNIQYSYCTLTSHFPRYPGDDCMNDKECYTGHCLSGICVTRNNTLTVKDQSSASCNSDSECDRKLYCNKNKKCSPIIPEGGACSSTNSSDCISGTLCLQQKGNSNFYCRYPYSQNGGQDFSLTINGATLSSGEQKTTFDQMCSSASYNTSTKKCNGDPERTQGGWTQECTGDQQCRGTYNTQSKCACFPNTELNKQYCVGFEVETNPCFSDWHSQAQRDLYNCYPFEYSLQEACGADSTCGVNNPVPSDKRGNCYTSVFGTSYLKGDGGNGDLLIANYFAMKFSMLILGMILIFILI